LKKYVLCVCPGFMCLRKLSSGELL
jgi:hypothetical protein